MTKRNLSLISVASTGDDVTQSGGGVVFSADATPYAALVRGAIAGPSAGDAFRTRAAVAARGSGAQIQALLSPHIKVGSIPGDFSFPGSIRSDSTRLN